MRQWLVLCRVWGRRVRLPSASTEMCVLRSLEKLTIEARSIQLLKLLPPTLVYVSDPLCPFIAPNVASSRVAVCPLT